MANRTDLPKTNEGNEKARKPRASAKRKPQQAEKRQDAPQETANDVQETKETASQRLFREEEVKRLVAQEVAKREEAMRAQIAPIVVKMNTPESERVLFLWQAPVADYNVLLIGENGIYGRVTGKTDTFWVPKAELSRVLTEQVRNFIKRRWLIVLSGLTEEEREALGCNYSEGEILPRAAFRKMLDMGEQLVDLFPGLCESHKRMVAQFLAEAYDAGDERVTRDLVVKLNKITKAATKDAGGEDDAGRRGMFAPLIEKMNAQDAKA